MTKTKTSLPNRLKIFKYHFRHVVVCDPTSSKDVFEALEGFGASHAAAIKGLTPQSPEDKCKAWLIEQGYFPVEGTDEWQKGKAVVVRWQATYETTIIVPADADLEGEQVKDAAANIEIHCPGSEYQTDTWEVESITNIKPV